MSFTKHYFSSPKYYHELQAAKCFQPVYHNIKYVSSRFNFYVYSSQAKAVSLSSVGAYYTKKREERSRHRFVVKASESPYQVLGVSPSATPDQIKRAYRKLALKYHPDVNKEANAQEKFMRIKHAYNTLMNSKSKKRYDGGGGRASDYSYNTAGKSQSRMVEEEEDFYGFGDFFRDLQEEFRNWEANVVSQGKPKSLWEELAEIGEEFVEFLEKELNITDLEAEEESKGTGSDSETEKDKGSRVEDSIDEIEAALAQLKKDLGL